MNSYNFFKGPRVKTWLFFTITWEQRKLGELALFNPKDELPQTFEYVDLESVVGTEMLSHRTEAKSSAPSRAQRLAHTGDLFYQTVRPYQRSNYLFEKPDNNYVFSTGYAQMRPYVDGYFLLSLVQSDRFVKVVLDNCTGTSYPAINANDLAEIEVAAPLDENESQKIGTIFRNIDNLITLHQRKYDKLTNVKKSMLEKMFPKNGSNVPEIRFKGFTEAWEQRKAKELCSISTGKSNTQDRVDDGKYPFYVRSPIVEHSNRYLFDEEAVLTVGDGVGTGKVFHYVNGKYDLHQRVYRMFDFSKEITGRYFYYYFSNHFYNRVMAMTAKTSVDSVRYEMIAYMDIAIPTVQEQQAISAIFENLDNLITLHQRELEKLKNLKKACLEKMFV